MPSLDNLREWIGNRSDQDIQAAESVLLIGLGRFGTALASTMITLGVEVMAIDTNQARVNKWADKLTHVRLADATNADTLRQLGASNFDAAVVAIGTGIEASILTTAALSDVGVKQIWAKAITDEHGRILSRVGAHHVVFPERQMGERVAHAVTGDVVDYFQLDVGFVLAEMETPGFLVGKPLGQSGLRQTYSVTVVCVKPASGVYTYATPETILETGDLMVIAGATKDVAKIISAAR